MKINKLLKIGIIGLSLVTLNATNIKQVQDVSKYPISSDLISVSRGGTLPDKKAITDGIGTVLVGSLNLSNKSYSNKTFNKALFNHRNEIIDNDKSLETLISDGIVVIPNNQLDKINNRNILVDITNSSNIPNGTSCNDNNPQTINDIYTNNVCTGNNVEGNSCNDNDSQTINDVYNNGVCVGTNVENQTCDDNNPQTINDIYTNGTCVGTNVERQICDDGDNSTVNTTYHNGICQGGNLVGDTCDDSNSQTINDLWLSNGNCIGTNVEGNSCDDGDNTTINTTYHNGICQGGNIVGDTCDDSNAQTINDIWLSNGTCVGTNVEGNNCDDGDNTTVNTTYHNGICQGDIIGNSCDDSNNQTINDVWLSNGTCQGTNVEGQSCDDGDNTTVNTTYHNGTCQGGNIIGNSCDDSNTQTINDIWLSNGTCQGTNVEGNNCDDGDTTTVNTTYHNGVCQGGNIVGDTCDDGNVQTIDDVWLSDGTCVGTNVEGQSCDDGDSQTTNDIYTNGVCSGTPIITITGDDTSGRTWNDGTIASSCNEYKNNLPDTIHKYQGDIGNGIYKINPDGTSFNVYCDMNSNNGGWTLVWSHIKNMANNPAENLDWNTAINTLPLFSSSLSNNLTNFQMYTGLKYWNKIGGHEIRYDWALYGTSLDQQAIMEGHIGDSSDNYTLHLSSSTNTIGSVTPGLFWYHNNYKFGTYDNNLPNCSISYSKTPWWYNSCWRGSINGAGSNSKYSNYYHNGAYWRGANSTSNGANGDGYGNGWIYVR